MFRLWGKCLKDGRTVRDTIIEDNDYSRSRTRMVLEGLTEICREFDLAEPIWLDAQVREFQRLDHTRFRQENFMDDFPFDYLEIRVLEE